MFYGWVVVGVASLQVDDSEAALRRGALLVDMERQPVGARQRCRLLRRSVSMYEWVTARRVRDVEDRSPVNNGDEFVARCGVVFVQRPN